MKIVKQFYALSALVLAALCTLNAGGQNAEIPIGIKPNSPYVGSDIDHIDLATGNVVGTIPIVSFPQKGKLPPLTFSAIFNTSPWYIEVTCDPYGDDCIGYYIQNTDSHTGDDLNEVHITSNISGVSIGGGDSYTQIWCGTDYWPYVSPDGMCSITWYRRSFAVMDESGAAHSMLWDTSDPNWAHATDGSGFSYYGKGYYNYWLWRSNIDGAISGVDAGTIYDPNGNSIDYNALTGTVTITDTSGNSISAGVDPMNKNFIDSVGRNILNPYYVNILSSTTGCPDLGDPNQAAQYAAVWNAIGPNGENEPYLLCYIYKRIQPHLYPNGANGVDCDTMIANLSDTPDEEGSTWSFQLSAWSTSYTLTTGCNINRGFYAIQAIVLPTGKYWGFLHDIGTPYTSSDGTTYYTESYGTVKKIFLPSGGSISYTYANRFAANDDWLSNINSRVVTSRTETDAYGQTSTRHFTYSIPSNGTMTTTESTDDKTIVHTFRGSFARSNTQPIVEIKRQTYQGTVSGTPLEEVTTSYNTTSTENGISPVLPTNVITKRNGTIVSDVRKTYNSPYTIASYNCYSSTNCAVGGDTSGPYRALWGPLTVYLNQVTRDDVYDGSGILLRTTQTTPEYMVDSSYLARNQVNLIGSVRVMDGNSNTLSLVSYGYDESGRICTGTSGNQTSASRWLNTSGQSLTSRVNYDCHNMPTSATDAMGNVTTTTYDSTGIFPSSIQHNGSLTDYYTYDANTGSLLAHVDPNGSSINDTAHKTSYSYDAIGRLTKVVYPPAQHGTPETNICYTDVGGASCAAGSAPYSVYTANLMSTGRNGSTLIQTYDGLGKISATVAPSGAITNTSYDSDGRIYSVTNPYYTTNDSTYGTVYYSYDALDRKVEQIQQSGATQTWQYTGNTTLFSDEKVVHWSRTADALGRLVKVLEPNGAGTGATMETDYSYDALGNLVSVVQMGRSSSPVSRSFTYDSISRLLTASNPETGTVCYGVWNGSACSDGYDANGNLLYRTDARGVVTTYAYDTFNRLTSKMYSDGATPASCYQYYTSSPANGIGRLFNAWTQKAGTSCSSSPQDGDYLSLNSILSYDALGHPVSMLHKHCIGAACTSSSPYSLAMDYDLAGNVIGLSNSAGANGASLALSSTFDSASRLCLMTSSWNVPNSSGSATVPQNLFQSDPSNGYLALGTLHAWYLGSNGTSVSPDCSGQISAPISVQQEYTNRQWLQSIQAVKQP